MQLHHLALGTDDPEALAAFYIEHLGLTATARHMSDGVARSVWLDLDGVTLMIERRDQPPRAVGARGVDDGLFLFALKVDKAERTALSARLVAAGVPEVGRTDFTSYFTDPDGNRFALSHYPDR